MGMVQPAILNEIRACRECAKHLPLGPNPVVNFATGSRIAIVGQAPGKLVHLSGIPWDDPSGDRLRKWLGVGKREFYDPERFAIVPMGFCYPGKGKSGDLPPRPECAPLWHSRIFGEISSLKLTLLFGGYSQSHYLGDRARASLTETVRNFGEYLPEYLPLPHPSPRNRFWMSKNPWFEEDVLPVLRSIVREILDQPS